MDDQELDPIAEALSAVSAQFAGERPPDSTATLDADALPYDDEEETIDASPSDDPDADAEQSSDDDTTAEAAPAFDWDSDDNPYKSQAIQANDQVQRFNTAMDLMRRIQAAKQAEAEEQDAQALIAQLQEVDPQMAEQYSGQRQGLLQRTAEATHKMVGWQHSMAAMALAMREVLGDEAFEQVRALGEEIVKHPNLDGMQQALANKRQAATASDKRVAELEEALRLALLQNGARQRPKAADVVDSAPAARAKIARPEDADNMDDYFAALAPQLDAHFGSR